MFRDPFILLGLACAVLALFLLVWHLLLCRREAEGDAWLEFHGLRPEDERL